jgi:DNA-binding response OmpR family regulator
VNKKILIIHGDRKVRRMLTFLLADAGFDVRAFAKPSEATALARQELLDLAIVDHETRTKDKADIIEGLKAVQPTVPIVLLVADPSIQLIINSIRVGVSEIVDKPDNLREVLEKVNALARPGATLGEIADEADLTGALAALGDSAPAEKGAAPVAKPADSGAIGKQAAELKQQVMRLSKEQGDLEVQTDRAKRELESVRAEVSALESKRTDYEKFEEQAQQASGNNI